MFCVIVFFAVLFCIIMVAVILMAVRYHRHEYLTPQKVSLFDLHVLQFRVICIFFWSVFEAYLVVYESCQISQRPEVTEL